MLVSQSVLFFLGHPYYTLTRRRSSTRRVSDDQLPHVAILVPCHNEEKVIANTLRALLALDYPAERLEILVINDGSTDRTADQVRSLGGPGSVRLLNVPAARGSGRGFLPGPQPAQESPHAVSEYRRNWISVDFAGGPVDADEVCHPAGDQLRHPPRSAYLARRVGRFVFA